MTMQDIIDFQAYGLLLAAWTYGVIHASSWLVAKALKKAGLWMFIVRCMVDAAKYRAAIARGEFKVEG